MSKLKRVCKNCSIEFFEWEHRVKQGKGIYCSRRCMDKYKNKHGFMRGKNNPNWKGNNVKYSGLHYWLGRNRKKKGICRICNLKKKTSYAKKEGEYTRNINNYLELCYSCHGFYDEGYSIETIKIILDLRKRLKNEGRTGAVRLLLH